MRISVSSAVIVLALAETIWPQPGVTQPDRDFVFTDLEGHLVIRFPGTGATGLDSSQAEEVLNAELSSMVHDRLRADLLFEAEPRDADWAAWMEPQIEKHLKHPDSEFLNVAVECRAASCRVVMEQPAHSTVTAHRAVLETVQESIEAFIATRRQHFKPVFMIAAYDQEPETPHIKVFLRRTDHAGRVAGTDADVARRLDLGRSSSQRTGARLSGAPSSAAAEVCTAAGYKPINSKAADPACV